MSINRPLVLLLSLLPLLAISGCGEPDSGDKKNTKPKAEYREYIEQGDLPDLKARGFLRILTVASPDGPDHLPRQGLPARQQLLLAEEFAHSEGLEPVRVHVSGFDELLPALLEGRGDLIAANLTVTASRQQRVAFSSPLDYSREQLVTRSDDPISGLDDLKGRRIAVQQDTSFAESAQRLKRLYPHIEVELLPPRMSDSEILDGVAQGRYDLTISDSNILEVLLAYRDDLKAALVLGKVRPMAWAVRPDSRELLARLNTYLGEHHLARRDRTPITDDLGAIKRRGVLRVLTRNNAATYFLWRGELLGFEYELVKRFADSQGLRLEMVVPPRRDLLIPWLLEGHGDLVAASLTIREGRSAERFAFTRPYNTISEVVVSRADEKGLQQKADLAGRNVAVRRSSNYWHSLQGLQQEGIDLELEAAPETLETEELIGRVAEGQYDLTMADSNILDIELTWRDDIRAALSLGKPRHHAWAVRQTNPKLLQALNTFIKKEYRGVFYNLTYRKYFENPKSIANTQAERVDRNPDNGLSPYDSLAKRYADRYGLDWRLVIAQMYQESRFDPKARSWMGALGLMQVLPRTAKAMGLDNLHDPASGIHAGVKYLDRLRNRFEASLPVAERTWFALAAYNAGAGHVADARRLARQKGWDPDRWFDNVEKAMLLLSKRQYASKARHGYVRGEEPVNYVRAIRDRYLAYLDLAGNGLASR